MLSKFHRQSEGVRTDFKSSCLFPIPTLLFFPILPVVFSLPHLIKGKKALHLTAGIKQLFIKKAHAMSLAYLSFNESEEQGRRRERDE